MDPRNSLSHHYLLQATDKGTWHSYIDNYYNNKFTPLKYEKINLLEIGVWWGSSIKLWHSFFPNATIFAIDPWEEGIHNIANLSRVVPLQIDGYSLDTVNKFQDNFFDIVIEDGLHNIESQIFAAQHWSNKLKPGGSLIIEDIKDANINCNLIAKSIPNSYNFTFSIFDYRSLKNRFDDVILEITKNK